MGSSSRRSLALPKFLKVEWTPETQAKVMSQLDPKRNGSDVGLLNARRGLKRVK